MHRIFLGFACLTIFSGCNSNPDAAGLHFDPSEAAYINQQGKGKIEGHAFLRDKHGQVNVRYAAGEIVRLVPATAYARARFATFYGGSKFVPAISIPKFTQNEDYAAFTRTTKAESTGRFTFDNVAPGRYFVTTQLIWQPKDTILSEGGAMYEEVTVTGTETDPIKVVLSGN
jgi:hypothetical protein